MQSALIRDSVSNGLGVASGFSTLTGNRRETGNGYFIHARAERI
jgi:hypothetical protein